MQKLNFSEHKTRIPCIFTYLLKVTLLYLPKIVPIHSGAENSQEKTSIFIQLCQQLLKFKTTLNGFIQISLITIQKVWHVYLLIIKSI